MPHLAYMAIAILIYDIYDIYTLFIYVCMFLHFLKMLMRECELIKKCKLIKFLKKWQGSFNQYTLTLKCTYYTYMPSYVHGCSREVWST